MRGASIGFLFAAGKLVDNKISWRGDSGLKDGSDASLDLSKGMYDAGDHMKFGFPMAFTATVLSWSILEYGDQMDTVGQLDPARDSLKWITDYLINAHPSENVLYIQVPFIFNSFVLIHFCLGVYILWQCISAIALMSQLPCFKEYLRWNRISN